MLDRKYVDAYNGISAPEVLLDKIRSGSSQKKSFNHKWIITAAACILLMSAMIPVYLGMTVPEVTLMQPYTTARSIETQIPIIVEAKRTSTVSVSSGNINIRPDEEIIGKTELLWSIAPTDTEQYILTVEDRLTTKEYSLSYNEKTDSWTIIEN